MSTTIIRFAASFSGVNFLASTYKVSIQYADDCVRYHLVKSLGPLGLFSAMFPTV
jgi:hypothetical protein